MQRAGYCQTVWANSQDSKIHELFRWSIWTAGFRAVPETA